MTDNKIIELTPFRVSILRSLARRGERLLVSPDLAEEVADLEPLEAYYIIREIGLDLALPIMLELSPEQLEACVDLDCWNRYDFAADNLDEWLTVFAQDSPESLAQAFSSLDYVVQLLFLTKLVTVYDPDTDQVPADDDENDPNRAMTPDGFFLLELKNEVALRTHPFALLDALYQYDPGAAHQLLSDIRVDLQIQIEEEALRFRNGRMEDLGFSGPDEAAVLFSRPNVRQPLPPMAEPLEIAPTRMPSVYAGPLGEISLLEQALSRVTDREELSRLEQEIVWAINGAIIAYGEKTQEIKLIADIAERVRDTISLGLEVLLNQAEPECPPQGAAAVVKAAALLAVWNVTDLFRHGFAATLGLQQEVRQALADPGFSAWFNLPDTGQAEGQEERLARAFVNALRGRHPLRGGFDPGKVEKVLAFASLAEIKVAQLRLQRLVAGISAGD